MSALGVDPLKQSPLHLFHVVETAIDQNQVEPSAGVKALQLLERNASCLSIGRIFSEGQINQVYRVLFGQGEVEQPRNEGRIDSSREHDSHAGLILRELLALIKPDEPSEFLNALNQQLFDSACDVFREVRLFLEG